MRCLIKIIKPIAVMVLLALKLMPSFAQNNPGYLGYTKSIDFSAAPLFSNILAGGSSSSPSFGLGYEMSTKPRFSLRFGIQQCSNVVSQKNMEFYDNKLSIPDANPSPWGSSYNTGYATGSFKYKYRAFSIATKFFKTQKGAVAPYGSYFGFDLSYGTARVTDASDSRILVNKNGTYETMIFEQDPWKNVKIISLQFNMGRRRYFGNSGISFFYQLGVGYPMWQSGATNLSETVIYFNNHQDLLENAMVRHIANGSLVELKFGLGYGIK